MQKKTYCTRKLSTRRCSHFEIDTAIVPSQPLRNPIPQKGLSIRATPAFPFSRRKGINSCRCHNTAILASIRSLYWLRLEFFDRFVYTENI